MRINVPGLEVTYSTVYIKGGKISDPLSEGNRATLTMTYDGKFVGETEIDGVLWEHGDDSETIREREAEAIAAWLRRLWFPQEEVKKS